MNGKSSLTKVNTKLKLLLSLGFAVFLGIICNIQLLIPILMSNQAATIYDLIYDLWNRLLIWTFLSFFIWLLSINLIWFLDNKFSIYNSKTLSVLGSHFLNLIFVTSLNSVVSTISIFFYVNNPRGDIVFFQIFITRFVINFPIAFLVYLGILGVKIGFNYYQKYQKELLLTSQLETHLAQSQLQTLKAQLQPHFLFNTLNGIAGLVRNDEKQVALETINELSTLLRYVVENSGKDMVELKEEIEFNKLYLDLHQKRFSDRMRIEMDIADETLPLQIPNLILQPLIENTIVHGVAKCLDIQTIWIKSRIENGRLKIFIKNGIVETTDDLKIEKGIGLKNTMSRLEKNYQNDFTFEIKYQQNQWFSTEMSLPVFQN